MIELNLPNYFLISIDIWELSLSFRPYDDLEGPNANTRSMYIRSAHHAKGM